MNHHHVKSVIASCVQNIQEKEECLWWIHQDMLLDWLGVDYNGLDKQIVISLLLKFIKKGKLCFENDDELKLPCNVVPSLHDLSVVNSLSLFSYRFSKSLNIMKFPYYCYYCYISSVNWFTNEPKIVTKCFKGLIKFNICLEMR